jgi:transcriptional regulator with PAS, ATPase and Fis domain
MTIPFQPPCLGDEQRPTGSVRRQWEELNRRLELAELVLNHIYNGALVTDEKGKVILFNEPYGRFLKVDPAKQIGRHVTEVVENTRMHIVAQTGRAEINATQSIQGQDMVVQRIPIKKDGRVIAVFGQVMFKSVRDVGSLARRLSLLESKVKEYEEELTTLRSTKYTMDSIQGRSETIRKLKKEALKAARTNLPVLITGESGTGKELFAQAIHHSSKRRTRPFIRLNCSAIPKDLFESELFGYERGAFTGARSEGKPGKFDLVRGGTFFLDEIGDLPLELQPKLLRVIEEREFERVGGTGIVKADFRLIAATNQNLQDMISARTFRKDLFYRLGVIPLFITPLRERREDILPIVEDVLADISEHTPGRRFRLTRAAENALLGYHWPGNGRELHNTMEQAAATAENELIDEDDLPFYLTGRTLVSAPASGAGFLKDILARAEKEALRMALAQARNNKSKAADLLGVHRTLFYKKLRKHGLLNSANSG